jgi:secreted PhoX family phosphatase
VLLRGGLAAGLAPLFTACATPERAPRLGFASVPTSSADALVVAEGYTATPMLAWGEPVGIAGVPLPAWRDDAGNSAAEQALQMGMHHDGMHYVPIDGSRRGLLVMNHEYVDDGLLHATGTRDWSAEKVAKSQAAHGISVVEVALNGGAWQPVRPSPLARRITATTPLAIGGPAAGHALMRTAADPTGTRVLGTFANCAAGLTPWGTYLSGEENFQDYFVTADTPTRHEQRWGLRPRSWYQWAAHDSRFDTVRHPNEPNRFGWVVEVDPADPASTPVKRTALGRAVHEGAWVAVTRDGRAVVYSGEDAAFEFIYKFVSRDRIRPGGGGLTAAQANRELLDHGTLYVARFDADGRGRWLPLVHGQGPLTAANGFDDQGEVLIKARQASDALGATMMDRPEWLAIDATSRWVYCTLTNNTQRGPGGRADVDAANPRANNTMGQIIRWREDGDFDGLGFEWNHLALAGDPANDRPEARGTIVGDAYASPDTIAFDPRGVLWIGSDISTSALHRDDNARLGNNALLACDVATGTTRRFMVGPANCELTGVCFTPDGRTMFVNVQHPGEAPRGRNDPADPRRHGNWPDFRPGGRPRSATVVVRRRDGGVIGA